MLQSADIVVVGGGIVGVATAERASAQFPSQKVVLLEKEPTLAFHQTGRNSGVIHSGIYYKPGSLKAQLCRDGRKALLAFCKARGLPFELCGKVIVATSDDELPRLNTLFERGIQNGLKVELIGPEGLRDLEPDAAGIKAVRVPEAGIVDYKSVTDSLARVFKERGGEILLGTRAERLTANGSDVHITTNRGMITARLAVNCAGLHSDRVCESSGVVAPAKIIPFRGEYYEVASPARALCRNLIYPVPDPRFPFLGVHFTRMIGGGIECGPNAVLAFAREGYRRSDVNLRDLAETLFYRGFQKLAAKHWRMGLSEWHRSLSKSAFVDSLQKLVPRIRPEDLVPGQAGVRAQAVTLDGNLVDDFLIQSHGRVLHVLNAPSPAATASLAIAEHIVNLLHRLTHNESDRIEV